MTREQINAAAQQIRQAIRDDAEWQELDEAFGCYWAVCDGESAEDCLQQMASRVDAIIGEGVSQYSGADAEAILVRVHELLGRGCRVS